MKRSAPGMEEPHTTVQTGQTAFCPRGPGWPLGREVSVCNVPLHIPEHPGLYEQECGYQVKGCNDFPLSNKPWNFMPSLGSSDRHWHTGGSPVEGHQDDERSGM